MKTIIKSIKHVLNYFGIQVSKYSEFHDAYKTQKLLMGNKKLTIIDVGGYDGDTSLLYNKFFPNSNIICFEPFVSSFLKGEQNTADIENITMINKGLGAIEGKSTLEANQDPTCNSILKTGVDGDKIFNSKGKLKTIETVEITLTTLDKFVETNAIDNIDILKMDVQGAEYMVLNGGKTTFKKGKVKLIYLEIIALPAYDGQIHFDETLSLLRSYGFKLHNFYNYSLTGDGQLSSLDAIFLKI
jgi:FkbM family methyltransferase